MAKRRIFSSTNIYHVVLRGVNKQTIFYETEDYKKFKYVLLDCREKKGFVLHAYCLMENHVHLLIETRKDNISNVMKSLEVRYVRWYNKKYGRVGHLFQNRFKSEPIEKERHFLCAVRYIINNPVKAGTAKYSYVYPWSSAIEYISENRGITDTELTRGILGSINEIRAFLLEEGDDEYIDAFCDEVSTGDNENEVVRRMLEVSGCKNMYEVGQMGKIERDNTVHKLLAAGFTQRQIARMCGISISMVNRISKK